MKSYTKTRCTACGGSGQVSNFGPFGLDFLGPKECSECQGNGSIIRYESGVLAAYPGGPLLGRVRVGDGFVEYDFSGETK